MKQCGQQEGEISVEGKGGRKTVRQTERQGSTENEKGQSKDGAVKEGKRELI